MTATTKCLNSACPGEIRYWEVQCSVCGTQHSFPNVRAANDEKPTLDAKYDVVVSAGTARNASAKLSAFEAIAERANMVVNVSPEFLYGILQDPKRNYASYVRQVEAGIRDLAHQRHHTDRGVVEEWLFPGFRQHILYGALSNLPIGLSSYGRCCIVLRDIAVEQRASVLIENSFNFFEHHFKAGMPTSSIPPGYRSGWTGRGRLAIVKLGSGIGVATSDDVLKGLILTPAATKAADEFMEVHLYGMFDVRALQSVHMRLPVTDPHEIYIWSRVKDLADSQGIPWTEES